MDRVGASLSYLVSSLAMTTFNKYIVSLRFPGMHLLLLVECLAVVVSLWLSSPGKYRPWAPHIYWNLPAGTLAKALNMIFSFIAMQYTSLPVYNVLKRLNIVFSCFTDYLIRGETFTIGTLLSVGLIAAGAVATGWGDLDFDWIGYVVAFPAGLMNAAYLVLSRRAHDKISGIGITLTPVDMLFYTAFFNLVIFAPLTLWEIESVANFLQSESIEWGIAGGALVGYIVMGAFLNYATMWCTTANSPLATGITGNFKGIFSTWIGFAFFGSSLTSTGWLGLLLNTGGGVLYCCDEARREFKTKRSS